MKKRRSQRTMLLAIEDYVLSFVKDSRTPVGHAEIERTTIGPDGFLAKAIRNLVREKKLVLIPVNYGTALTATKKLS